MGDDAERTGSPEITGEIPAFVREALDRPVDQPVDQDALDGDAREVVAALIDLGLDAESAEEAVRGNRVALALAQQSIGDKPRYDLARLADKAGIPGDTLRTIRGALGLPHPERYSRTDLTWARQIARLLDVLPVDAVIRAARARGNAVAAIARSDIGTVRDELILPMRKDGADDLTVAVALAETARELQEVSRKLLVSTYGLVLEHQLGSEISAIAARSEAAEFDIAVGFVDVVGYTALSARIDPVGLDHVLEAFEGLVGEVIAEDTGVSVVKYLGDAVMLVAPDAPTLARAMLEMTRERSSLSEAPLKGGMAAGATLVREGDFFGAAVNMAARLTDIARPWSLLAAEELVEQLDDDFDVRRILPTRIRGVGLRRPVRVRPPEEDERAEGD